MKLNLSRLLNLFLLSVLSVSIVACQKPEKKSSDASVYTSGVQNLEMLAESIKELGLDLDSDRLANAIDKVDLVKKRRQFPQLKHQLKKGVTVDQIKPLLIQFVVAAEKLLSLGNSKTVVFPEKAKITQQHYVASYFLADIFFNTKFSSTYDSQFVSREVDHHEFNLRFARFGLALQQLKKAGFPIGEDRFLLPQNNRRNWAIGLYETCIDDLIRISVLLERNNNFGNEQFTVLSKNFMPMAGYFYNIIEVLKKGKSKKSR